MKTLIQGLLAGAIVVFSTAAFAECPLNMPTDELVECLTVEGSGENYQDYQLKLEEELADMAEETANKAETGSGDKQQELAILH